MKRVQIRSFFLSVFSRIRTEYGEIRSTTFCDIEIHSDGLEIYYKPTDKGQYTHYISFSLRNYKIVWIVIFLYITIGKCSKESGQIEIDRIKRLVAWNDFLKLIGKRRY